jgi:hypothetical protein
MCHIWAQSVLERIKEFVFEGTSFRSSVIPSNATFLGERCSLKAFVLRSLVFGSGSILKQTAELSFSGTGLEKFIFPSSLK